MPVAKGRERSRSWLLAAYEWTCAYCGAARATTLDHLHPRAEGGRSVPTNLVPACRPCNEDRGALSLRTWLLGRPDLDTRAITARIAAGLRRFRGRMRTRQLAREGSRA